MLKNVLAQNVLAVSPRILGLTDREPDSKTFGCGERYYWKYKLHDCPNSRFQETALLLAMLATTPFEGNIFNGKLKMAEWTVAMCDFWLQRRNRDGSCLEVYPNERSFCATTFSTWCICQALAILSEGEIGGEVAGFIARAGFADEMAKTGQWIVRNMHYGVSNQAAAAAVSLQSIAAFTGESVYSDHASTVVDRLLTNMGETRFKEYDGFDLGYATITLSCLTWYAELAGRTDEFRAVFREECDRLGAYIDDSGWYDSSAMSRGTNYLYPHVFVACGHPVADRIAHGLETNAILSPMWLDDRYCIGLAVDYMKSLRRLQEE